MHFPPLIRPPPDSYPSPQKKKRHPPPLTRKYGHLFSETSLLVFSLFFTALFFTALFFTVLFLYNTHCPSFSFSTTLVARHSLTLQHSWSAILFLYDTLCLCFFQANINLYMVKPYAVKASGSFPVLLPALLPEASGKPPGCRPGYTADQSR
jgi:hypothetical protein